MNGISRERSIRANANKFDFASLGSISFRLLDVDLYRATRKTLLQLYRLLSPGGSTLVNDCDPDGFHYDDAEQAYKDFSREIGADENIESAIDIVEEPGQPPSASR